MYQNYPNKPYNYNNYSSYENNDRFFLAPFLFGGIAGTALGYGLANNQNNQPYAYYYPYPPVPYYPVYSNTNYYY